MDSESRKNAVKDFLQRCLDYAHETIAKKLNLAMTYYAFMHAALQKMIDDSPDKGEPWHV
jgi:hypothetical protein